MTARSPMVVSDPNLPDNPLVLVNPAFCRMTGYQAAELLGRNCRLLQGPQTDPESVAILRRALDARREVTVDLLNYRRNGDAFWSEVFVAPVFSADGRLRHFIASQQDSTERRRSELARDPRLAGAQAARIASWRWEPATGQMTWGRGSVPAVRHSRAARAQLRRLGRTGPSGRSRRRRPRRPRHPEARPDDLRVPHRAGRRDTVDRNRRQRGTARRYRAGQCW